MIGWYLISFGIVASLLLFYIWIFIFISGAPSKGREYDKFVMKICSKSGWTFFRTLLTWGYFKRSFKTFLRHYRLKFFPVPQAELNCIAPNAQLVSLDGSKTTLWSKYISETEKMPLILNMGSYT